MKFLLFFVLLLSTVLMVISVTGFNDMIVLQPVSSPGLVLRKVPGTLPSGIKMPTGQRSPNIVFLRPVLFKLECLKEIPARGRLKNRSGSTRPESSIPGPEEPAYKTVNKNQGNNYDKVPDPYRPNTSFENEYFRGNVRVIPMPLPYRSNINRYHRYKPYESGEGNKLIKEKDSSPHSNRADNVSEIEKEKQKGMTPPFYTTSRIITSTTKRSPIEGSVNKPISVEITDERVIHYNDLITDKSGIPIQDNENIPTIVSYGDAKIVSKFSHQSKRMEATTASDSESTLSTTLWLESKPRLNHSYEVEEIIEENIRIDLEDKKEENHTTKKLPGGRQFKFDENAHERFTMVAPDMVIPAEKEVIDSSINTILNSLINPMKIISETEKSEMPMHDNDNLPTMVSYGDAKIVSKFSQPSKKTETTTALYSESASSSDSSFESKSGLNHSNEVEEIKERNIGFNLKEKKEENHSTKKPPGGRQFKFDENAHERFTMVAPDMVTPAKNEVIDSSINTILNSLINPMKIISETEKSEMPMHDNDNLPTTVSYGDAKIISKFSQPSKKTETTTALYSESASSSNSSFESKPGLNHSQGVEEIIEKNTRFDLEDKKEENQTTKKPSGGRQFKFDENAHEGFTIFTSDMMKPAKNAVLDSSMGIVLDSLVNPAKIITEKEGKTPDKSNNTIITPSLTLQNSSSQPNKKNSPYLPPLLSHSSVESFPPDDDESQNGYVTNTKYVSIAPNPHNNDFNFFRASTTETAQHEEKTEFPSHQSVPFQNFQNWDPHSTLAGKYDKLPLQQFFPKESQGNINLKSLEMIHTTDDDFSKRFQIVTPNDLLEPEVFRNRVDEFSKPDRILSTPKVVISEENKLIFTPSPIHYEKSLNLFTISPKNRSYQTTNPPESTQEVLFSPALPEVYNSLDIQSPESLAEHKEEKTVQRLFTSAPLSEFTVKNQNTETEQSERDEETSTQPEFFEIQTKFDLLDSKSQFETETHQSLLTPAQSSDDDHSINESVAFEDLFTTGLLTENTTTTVSHPEGEESLSSSSSTWMAVSTNDIKLTTERNSFEEKEDVKTTTFKEFTDVSETVDLQNPSNKGSAQESNWKSNRKMHFDQKPAMIVLDNQIIDNTQKGQRRSDILINDTLEDYGEKQNQASSLSYLESLKENSSHLNTGALIKIAPELIIPIIPKVINDLRDDRFSDENLKVLSHAFGKYWPYIQALSKNTNLDILPLIKMKDEKDLESILRSFVLEEPNTTTIIKRRDDENVLDYGHAYDYLGDYEEMYKDILNQEPGKENRKKMRSKRDEEEDLKTVEATREYFDSIAEEENEGGDYTFEGLMYDIPDDESDSSIIEMAEIDDLQIYVRNVTSQES